jgi:hypothetical protein
MAAESIRDRAARGEHEGESEQAQDELFPMGTVDGDGRSLKTIMKANAPTRSTVSISSAEIPSGGGLFDPERERTLLVTIEPGKVELVPVHKDGKVSEWKQRQTLRPTFIESASSYGAAQIEAMFTALLADDPRDAGKLLDKLKDRVESELAS